jgi:hypothetical protein
MKKFVIFALIAVMAAGVAFAQTNADGIGINAWGRGAFVPLRSVSAPQIGGEEAKKVVGGDTVEGRTYAGTGAVWGGLVRTDFRVNGNAEFIGFQIAIHEGGTATDLRNIWAKPFGGDILKIMIGSYEVDALRGKVGTDTGFENFVLGGIPEDSIFARFNAKGYGTAAIITSEPMEGLFIGLEIPGQGWGGNYNKDGSPESWNWGSYDWDKNAWNNDEQKLADAYRFMQIGFGYQIPDIGHLRAQWVGGWFGTVDSTELGKDKAKGKFDTLPNTNSWEHNAARIEVAFALTAVDNLLVDLGLKFWLPIEEKEATKYSPGIDLGVGATYRMDAFAIAANIIANFGAYTRTYDGSEWSKDADGIALGFNLIPTYDLDAATIGASIGLRSTGVSKDGEGKALEGDAKDNTMQFGFGAFVKKDLGSGHIKAGLSYATAETTNGKANGGGVFTIPIILEYAFF